MLLKNIEKKLKKTKDFLILEESFHTKELEGECHNIEHSFLNALKSNQDCLIRWVLYHKKFHVDHEEVLLPLLENNDLYIYLKTLQRLTQIYEIKLPSEKYFNFIKQKLGCTNSYEETNQILWFIGEVLRNRESSMYLSKGKIHTRDDLKFKFVECYRFIELLSNFLNVQEVRYQALRIIWILSFNNDCVKALGNKNIINQVASIFIQDSKEKLYRLCVQILKKTLQNNIGLGLSTAYEVLTTCNTYTDEEEYEDEINFIKEKLNLYLEKSANINAYLNELFNGRIEEAPYHFDDSFWENNVEVLVEHKVDIVKAMKRYFHTKNQTNLCVATNDLYRILKVAPEIYDLVKKFKLKEQLFKMSSSIDANLRFHAIQALALCIKAELNE